jgi:hypothetical protein
MVHHFILRIGRKFCSSESALLQQESEMLPHIDERLNVLPKLLPTHEQAAS